MKRDIVLLIDLQNGFSRYDLAQDQGGCLYVPEGEVCAPLAARMIEKAKDTFFILSQDFHPADHIGFMESHPAVMQDRARRLKGQGDVLNPLLLPFDEIYLEKDSAGKYRPQAFRSEGALHAVACNKKGGIEAILPSVLSEPDAGKGLFQTLWRKHCVAGSPSAQLADPLLNVLPPELVFKLENDTESPSLSGYDGRGNVFYVVRKGRKSDLDSYGIATENDGLSFTTAPSVFAAATRFVEVAGVTQARIGIGGLATNFCVASSYDDLRRFLVPMLQAVGIKADVMFLQDVSRGIPLPSLDQTLLRIKNDKTIMGDSASFLRPSFGGGSTPKYECSLR